MSAPVIDPEEERARNRYFALNAARIGGIVVTMMGLAGVQKVLPLPHSLSVVLAFVGVAAFFFGPPLMVKRWKVQDKRP